MPTTRRKPSPRAAEAAGDAAADALARVAVEIATMADVEVEADNWVGALQNAAVARGTTVPAYVTRRDHDTPDHQARFVCRCDLAGVTAEAEGTTKQAAKRAAARTWVEKML